MSFSAAKSLRIAVLLGSFLLSCAGSLRAQATSGSITGTVVDNTGASIPGATVTVSSDAIGVSRTVTSNEAGTFVVPNLVPGDYTIRIEAKGFKQLEQTGVRLSATDRLNLGNLVMEIGGMTESVTVTADTAELQLQASSGERSDLITGNQLNNLALNGRNIIDFVRVVPGVVSYFNGQVAGTGGIDAFNINGTRSQSILACGGRRR